MNIRQSIFILVLAGTLVAAIMPGAEAPTLGLSDKINHMAAFVVLAALAAWAWPRTALPGIAIALSAFGAVIELVQALPLIGRDAEVADWAADTFAVLVTLTIVAVIRRVSRRDLS